MLNNRVIFEVDSRIRENDEPNFAAFPFLLRLAVKTETRGFALMLVLPSKYD